jgi:hypothetical protein
MVQFSANTVVVDDTDESYILVGFADIRDGQPREALHFQRSYEFGEQNVEAGMDQVYVERNDQHQGGYGGIRRVELRPEQVRVWVDDRAAQRLGDSAFEIGLSLSPQEFERLRSGLRAVFHGLGLLSECFTERQVAS